MRVTFRTVHDGVRAAGEAADQFIRAQRQVETGKKLNAPSDDPAAMQRVIEGRADLASIDSYSKSGDTANSRLSIMDTVLGDVVERLTSAKTAAASARGTTANAGARATVAATLTGLRDSLAQDLNSTFRGRYLFSGAQTGTPGYAQIAGVWTYQGDHTPVTVDVAQSHSVTIAMDGDSIAKGADSTNIFTELDSLIAAVQAGDENGMANGMAAIDRAFDRAIRAQSLVGVDEKSIDDEQQRLTQLKLAGVKRVNQDENADLAQAATEMTQAQTAYQAALQAVGSASKVSLLDYLR